MGIMEMTTQRGLTVFFVEVNGCSAIDQQTDMELGKKHRVVLLYALNLVTQI